jgi:hypothetical protein
MCLILHRPIDKTFDSGLFVPAIQNNPHGFGIMFPMGDGRVKAIKGMFNLETIYKIWEKVAGREVAAHFRFTTAGAKNVDNCHPFKVLDFDEHGRDLYMMHNGTMGAVPRPQQDMSDTWHFVENYLRKALVVKPELIDNPEFQKFLGDIVGSNKLLFMDGKGLVTIINGNLGSERDGCWISNTYSIRDKSKITYSSSNTAYRSSTKSVLDADADWETDASTRRMSKRERRLAARERERTTFDGRDRAEREADLAMAFAHLEDDGAPYRGLHSRTDAEFRAQELAEVGGFSDAGHYEGT